MNGPIEAHSHGAGGQGRSLQAPPIPPSLALILVAYLILGIQYAALTPAWQVPDEPAHYNVIRQIAQTGVLPRLEPGDYDQAYLERLTGERFPAELPLDRVQYQDYQPPLYYLLATPIFLFSSGSLLALRLFSVALGVGVLAFAFLAVQTVTGAASSLPALTAGLLAFIPQHVAMLAGVNNDSLSELLVAAGLYLLLREIGHTQAPSRPPAQSSSWPIGHWSFPQWSLGLVLGLAFLTKVWAYLLAPAAAVMLLLRWRRAGWANWRPIARRAAQIFLPALLLGALYWGRNWLVCGPADVLCGSWHNQVVLGQPRTIEWLAQYGWAGYLERFLRTTFQSFWGQFGWMGVVMDQRVYLALLAFTVGLGLGAARAWARVADRLTPAQRDSLAVLAAVAGVVAALYLYYNATFVQFQGRYLFSALVPLGLAAAAGLSEWGDLAAGWLGRPAGRLLPWGVLLALAGLCLLALYRFILPALAP